MMTFECARCGRRLRSLRHFVNHWRACRGYAP